jgi:hypothetical protein
MIGIRAADAARGRKRGDSDGCSLSRCRRSICDYLSQGGFTRSICEALRSELVTFRFFVGERGAQDYILEVSNWLLVHERMDRVFVDKL